MLFGTYRHELFCEGRGRSYVLSVALSEDYHASLKRYPVVYILDGDTLFGMAASLTMSAAWAQEAPELIAVGIGYGVDSYDQWAKLRELDLALPGATTHDATNPANSPQPDLFLPDAARGHRRVCRSPTGPCQKIAASTDIRGADSSCCTSCSINRPPSGATCPAAAL